MTIAVIEEVCDVNITRPMTMFGRSRLRAATASQAASSVNYGPSHIDSDSGDA